MSEIPHRHPRVHRILATWVIVLQFAAIVATVAAPVGGASAGVNGAFEVAETAGSPDVEPLDAGAPPVNGAVPVETVPAPTTTVHVHPEPLPAPEVASATTTPPPAPTPVPPAPTTTSAPAPALAPAPAAAPAPAESSDQRIQRAFHTGTPAVWRQDISVRFQVIEGSTSWANSNGTISISRTHVSGRFEQLVDVIAHEFGHLIAFEYGTNEYVGAAPAGWPAPAHRPEEAWADCVQTGFTGRENPSHGLAPCRGEQRSWAAAWLQTGPPTDQQDQ